MHVLGQTLAYKVDRINVVTPDDVSDLSIVRDADYMTLVTCTPYGVNDHRLLVRGERIDYKEAKALEAEQGGPVLSCYSRYQPVGSCDCRSGGVVALSIEQGLYGCSCKG